MSGRTPELAGLLRGQPRGTILESMVIRFRHTLLLTAACALAVPCLADEIRLKDGKKLYGVIVAYEENMFKVKTDFGYVLVEKDKISSIVPTTPAGAASDVKADSKAQPAKNGASDAAKADPKAAPKTEAALASGGAATPAAANASAKSVVPGPSTKGDKGTAGAKVNAASVKPALPPNSAAPEAGIKPTPVAANLGPGAPGGATSQPAAGPKEPEAPALREEVVGNVYVNHTQGFKMYKAPSWELFEGAQNALPNAVAAMGTSDESTLIVVGREKTKEPLETAAGSVEKRLHLVYEGYRQTSQRKTTVAGAPAVEFRYIGRADEHDWSGTLVVLGRAPDIFTVLGMTYADSDLIQIQENVIAKAVNSLSFDVK